MPSVPQIEAWLVIFVAAPVMWLVVLRLGRALRRQPDNGALRVTVLAIAWMAGLLTVFGLVFINNDIIPPPIGVAGTQVITRTYALTALLIGLYFLWLYRDSE